VERAVPAGYQTSHGTIVGEGRGACQSVARPCWQQAQAHVAQKKAADYDDAVTMLVDPRDLAARKVTTDGFRARISAPRDERRTKSAFIKRLDAHGLV